MTSLSRFAKNHLALSLILLGGTALRLWGFAGRDLWYDEAFTGLALRRPWPELVQLMVHDVHPPLYYFLLKSWTDLVGNTPFTLRILSVLFGVLTIWAVYLLVRELGNKRGALIAAGFAALSPFAIIYAQEARMYSMLAGMTLFSGYFFLRALATGRSSIWIVWGVISGLTLLVHYAAWMYLPLMFLTFFMLKRQNGKYPSWRSLLGARKLWLGLVLGTCLIAMWIPGIILQFENRNSVGWIRDVPPWGWLGFIQIFFFGMPPGEASMTVFRPWDWTWTTTEGALALTGTLLVVGIFLARRRNRDAWALALLALSPILLVQIFSQTVLQLMVPRYFITSAFLFFAAIGLLSSSRRGYLALGVYAVLIGLVVKTLPGPFYTQIAATQELRNRNIYTLNGFDYAVAKYYFPQQSVRLVDEGGTAAGWPIVEETDRVSRATALDDANGAFIWKRNYQEDPNWIAQGVREFGPGRLAFNQTKLGLEKISAP